MTSAPILALPDFKATFLVEADASSIGIGAVLTQNGRPVAYFSKSMGPKYHNLSIYEKEMLAILMAVKKWNCYLMGRHFSIKTDHQSLKFLLDQKTTTPAQLDWVVKMMGYNFDLTYRKGTHNTVADALSRKPVSEASVFAMSSISSDVLERIKTSWSKDPKLQLLVTKLCTPGAASIHKSYSWSNDQLLKNGKLVVGNDIELKRELISYFHAGAVGGHSGVLATIKRMTSFIYWKGMKKEVEVFIASCSVCQTHKVDNSAYPGLLQPLPIPERVWCDISMDFIEGLPHSEGHSVILVVVDRLSKAAHFIPLHHPYTALSIAQVFLTNVYKLHGMPNSIVSDRDKIFISNFWQELCKLQKIKLKMSTAYHPQKDGQTEVVNRSLEAYLRCMCSDAPKNWLKWLPLAEWWYNSSYHSSLKCSPYEVLYGQSPPTHMPYISGTSNIATVDRSLAHREATLKIIKFHLQRAQDRMKSQADKHRSERSFEIDDMVYVKLQPYRQSSLALRSNMKLAPKYFGPFSVMKKIGEVAYQLKLPPTAKIHDTFHVSQLKRHIGDALTQSWLPEIDGEGNIAKQPVKILDRRMVKRGNQAAVQVLVQWSNSFMEDASWEFLHDLKKKYPSYHP